MQIEEFLPEIYLDADGVPEAVAMNALRHVLREFCEDTEVWQEELDPISLLDGVSEYDLDVPSGAEVSHAVRVRYGTGDHPPALTEEDWDEKDKQWETRTGETVTGVVIHRKVVRVIPIPSQDDTNTLKIKAALRPKTDGDVVGDDAGRYSEWIVAGALARLKRVPGKPWTDREASAAYDGIFRKGKARCRGQVMRGNRKRSLQARNHRLGR